MWRALLAAGVRCGRHRVARLRRPHDRVARRVRRLRVLIAHHQGASPAPNRIWAGDLTAIVPRAGWIYLAVILDVYSRRVIGWTMSPRPDQQVALTALRMALTHRRPPPGLIHHTDHGATYTSLAYWRQLEQTGLVASMSPKGTCYDHAVVESFFSTLKNGLVHEQTFHTREEAQAAVFEFIEVFYTRQRWHQPLGYISPVQFEAAHGP